MTTGAIATRAITIGITIPGRSDGTMAAGAATEIASSSPRPAGPIITGGITADGIAAPGIIGATRIGTTVAGTAEDLHAGVPA